MDEKVEALLDNKEYEAAFDLIEKENFENFKKPKIQGMSHAAWLMIQRNLRTLTKRAFIPGFIIFQFQKDENGCIDFKKLLVTFGAPDSVLHGAEDNEEFMEFFKMGDRNDDGKISKEEFIRLMSKSRGSSYVKRLALSGIFGT